MVTGGLALLAAGGSIYALLTGACLAVASARVLVGRREGWRRECGSHRESEGLKLRFASRTVPIFLDAKPPQDAIANAANVRNDRLALGAREIYVA